MYAGNNYMQAMTAYSKVVKQSPEHGTILIHNGASKREHVGNGGERVERIEA